MKRDDDRYEIEGRYMGGYTNLRDAKRSARDGARIDGARVRVWALSADADCSMPEAHERGLAGHTLLGHYAADGKWTSSFIARARNGRYTFDGNWDRLCVCGHTLGVHAGEAPHDCFGPDGRGSGCATECPRFRPSRRKSPRPQLAARHWSVYDKHGIYCTVRALDYDEAVRLAADCLPADETIKIEEDRS